MRETFSTRKDNEGGDDNKSKRGRMQSQGAPKTSINDAKAPARQALNDELNQTMPISVNSVAKK